MNRTKSGFKRMMLLLGVCAAAALMYLVVFRSTHLVHECAGAKCAICHQVQLADDIARNLSLAADSVVPGAVRLVYAALVGVGGGCIRMRRTLVADKVRMDR